MNSLELKRKNFFVINGVILFFLIVSLAIPGNAATLSTLNPTDEHIHLIADVASPRIQFLNNPDIQSIKCAEGLELIMKKSNGMPACVKPSSVAVLIERGWGMHVLPDYTQENNNSDIFPLGGYDVTTSSANYFEQTNGFLAQPTMEGDYPAVIMIQEWWGLNENIKDMAKKLASHGYVVLAVDLYDGQVATTSSEAQQIRGSFDQPYWTANMNSAVKYLEETFEAQSIGSIGWCFGGGQSLNLALNNPNMDATVMYYGSPVIDSNELSKISWPVLGIFAGEDNGIPVETVEEFESTLNEVGIENEIVVYPGVQHAFANPSGDRYAPEEAKDAWQKTLDFFEMNLK